MYYSIDIRERWSEGFRNKVIDGILSLLEGMGIQWNDISFYDEDKDKRYQIDIVDRYEYLARKASAMNLKLKSDVCYFSYGEYYRANTDTVKTAHGISLSLESSFFKENEKALHSFIFTVLKKTKDVSFTLGFAVETPEEEPYLTILERYNIEDVWGIKFPIFGGNEYMRIISPSKYEPYFTKEDLLATPAYKVYEWDDEGRIFMQFYETAWDYDNPKAMGQIKRALDYLNACKKSPLDGLDLD